MRLATLAVVATMLLAVGPSIADHTPGHHVIDSDNPYQNSMTISDDAYVKSGWWAGEDTDADKNGNDQGDGGLAVDLSDGNTDARQEYELLKITEHSQGSPSDIVTVTVDTSGNVVGAIDVFKAREDGTYMTPDCPTDLLADLYPGDQGTFFYLSRILHETTDYHDRAVLDDSISVDLHLDRADDGFFVFIYPQAASSYDSNEDAEITYTASTDGTANLRDDQDSKQPIRPVHTDEWVGGGAFLTETQDCVFKGPPLPTSPTDGDLDELPGASPPEDLVGELFDADIQVS